MNYDKEILVGESVITSNVRITTSLLGDTIQIITSLLQNLPTGVSYQTGSSLFKVSYRDINDNEISYRLGYLLEIEELGGYLVCNTLQIAPLTIPINTHHIKLIGRVYLSNNQFFRIILNLDINQNQEEFIATFYNLG